MTLTRMYTVSWGPKTLASRSAIEHHFGLSKETVALKATYSVAAHHWPLNWLSRTTQRMAHSDGFGC